MSLLRILGVQGIAGIAISLALGIMLVVQTGETRHWQKQSGAFEQLYHDQRAELATTVSNYRAAADAARASDRANAERVAANQRTISERTEHEYEERLAAARAAAERLRRETSSAAADPGAGRAAPVSRMAGASGSADEAARQNRLPQPDALVATEQAIQLDELIKWVEAQAEVDPNASPRRVDSPRP
jgi:hypothetical protein